MISFRWKFGNPQFGNSSKLSYCKISARLNQKNTGFWVGFRWERAVFYSLLAVRVQWIVSPSIQHRISSGRFLKLNCLVQYQFRSSSTFRFAMNSEGLLQLAPKLKNQLIGDIDGICISCTNNPVIPGAQIPEIDQHGIFIFCFIEISADEPFVQSSVFSQ